jgi:hypothetical protein
MGDTSMISGTESNPLMLIADATGSHLIVYRSSPPRR